MFTNTYTFYMHHIQGGGCIARLDEADEQRPAGCDEFEQGLMDAAQEEEMEDMLDEPVSSMTSRAH